MFCAMTTSDGRQQALVWNRRTVAQPLPAPGRPSPSRSPPDTRASTANAAALAERHQLRSQATDWRGSAKGTTATSSIVRHHVGAAALR